LQLLRTCGCALILMPVINCQSEKADLYNPNIIRSSVLCIFTTIWPLGSPHKEIKYLINRNIGHHLCSLKVRPKPYTEWISLSNTIVVVQKLWNSSEEMAEQVLSKILYSHASRNRLHECFRIPAILIFEARRQERVLTKEIRIKELQLKIKYWRSINIYWTVTSYFNIIIAHTS